MGLVLTTEAVIMCDHGGKVTAIPRQEKVTIQGGLVLCLGDLIEAPIVGCAQDAPGTKPCTTVLPTPPTPGSISANVSIDGDPVHLDGFIAPTDGVPPATVSVVFAGQELVRA
jgi:hypothetical protein